MWLKTRLLKPTKDVFESAAGMSWSCWSSLGSLFLRKCVWLCYNSAVRWHVCWDVTPAQPGPTIKKEQVLWGNEWCDGLTERRGPWGRWEAAGEQGREKERQCHTNREHSCRDHCRQEIQKPEERGRKVVVTWKLSESHPTSLCVQH